MSKPDPRNAPLEEGMYYHVYNRGNGGENVFREARNYEYFIHKYLQHLEAFVDTFCYALLKNHFHLLVQIKSAPLNAKHDSAQAFANWFNAYAKGYNSVYARNGSLFQRPFRRIPVTSENYLLTLVRYIHRNPQKHGFVSDFREWEYSSYHALCSNEPTFLKRREVLEWFDGIEAFQEFHLKPSSENALQEIIGDDQD